MKSPKEVTDGYEEEAAEMPPKKAPKKKGKKKAVKSLSQLRKAASNVAKGKDAFEDNEDEMDETEA